MCCISNASSSSLPPHHALFGALSSFRGLRCTQQVGVCWPRRLCWARRWRRQRARGGSVVERLGFCFVRGRCNTHLTDSALVARGGLGQKNAARFRRDLLFAVRPALPPRSQPRRIFASRSRARSWRLAPRRVRRSGVCMQAPSAPGSSFPFRRASPTEPVSTDRHGRHKLSPRQQQQLTQAPARA